MKYLLIALLLPAFCVMASCSNHSATQTLTQLERQAIDSLHIDSTLVLEVKQIAKVDFHKMPGAVRALKSHKNYPGFHGIQVGFFDVDMNFDETPLEEIRERWIKKGYGIYTVKSGGRNRLMIKVY